MGEPDSMKIVHQLSMYKERIVTRMKTFSRMSSVLCLLAALALCMPIFGQDAAETVEPVNPSIKEKARKQSTSTFQAGEIVVKEKALASVENAATTTEITAEDIRARGDKTLDHAMQMVPGANVYQNAKGNMVFDIRGVQHGRMTMMVDGIPIEEVYNSGGGDISRIPIMNASRIVVSRGATSALYGTSATTGVINVVSKKPDALFAEASAEYGQYNNYTVNAAAGAPMGDAYFLVTATMMNSGGYEVSKKLNLRERTKWFNRLVQYWAYGKTFDGVTLNSKNNYLQDNDRWNETEFTRYQVHGKFGYKISEKIEAGISAYYYQNVQRFNSFYSNTNASYSDKSYTWSVPTGTVFTADSRKSIFVNRDWRWPEDYNYFISPYFSGEFGDFAIRANAFFTQQSNTLEGYADQNLSQISFPSSSYNPSSITNGQYNSYGNDRFQSIYLDTLWGIRAYPSYKLADWNKVTAGILFKNENHRDYEKSIDGLNIIAVHGTDRYQTRELNAYYFTLALEDETKLKTPAGQVAVTAGVSYDMQQITKYRKRNNIALFPANIMMDGWIPTADSTIWGTRDSFNTVVGMVYDPIENLLRVRAAFSRKTEFPSMSVYATNDSALADTNVKPEESSNLNAGFELFFLDNAVSYRCDYFYTNYINKIEKLTNFFTGSNAYFNIPGQQSHGLENTVNAELNELAKIVDLKFSFSYVYLRARNDHATFITRGDYLEKTPEHQLIAQLTMKFVSKTSFTFWGNHTLNQVQYVMRAIPQTAAAEPFSSIYYRTTKLHDPWMLHIKVSQEIWEHFSVWGMCKNILDDYNADPFNPGAGRVFYVGGSGKL
jgi:outer membrane receptor protein involved in Fe transport